jgi:hypothetical protein
MLKICTGCYDQLQSWWETWTVSLDKQSQARRQSSTVLFIFVIHAVSNTLDKKWDFTTPDFRWFPDTQVGSKPRGQLRGTNHSNKGTMFSFFKSYVGDTAFILLSRGVIAASSLSSLTFDVLVWLFTLEVRKAKTRKRRPFTFRGMDRNHRLLIWRTSKSTPTALCPFASSSNT